MEAKKEEEPFFKPINPDNPGIYIFL